MFKEQLKNDTDRISPSAELLNKVSLIMSEQAAKPRRNPYAAAIRYAGMAAAVFLLAFGAAKLGLFSGKNAAVSEEPAAETIAAAAAADEAEPVSEEAVAENEPRLYLITPEEEAETAAETSDGEPPAEVEAAEYAAADTTAAASDAGRAENRVIEKYPGEASVTGSVGLFPSDRPVYSFEEEAARIAGNDRLSLCRIIIIETLPDAHTGLHFASGGTVYRAYVTDLISGEYSEGNVVFAGTQTVQEPGNPIYQAGDELLCETETMNGELIIREYPLCDVYDTPAGKSLYMRIERLVIPGAENYADGDFSLITTTPENPARYYGIYDLDEFLEAFRNEIKAAAPETTE